MTAVGRQGLCEFFGVVIDVRIRERAELAVRLTYDEEGPGDDIPTHLTVGGEAKQFSLLVADQTDAAVQSQHLNIPAHRSLERFQFVRNANDFRRCAWLSPPRLNHIEDGNLQFPALYMTDTGLLQKSVLVFPDNAHVKIVRIRHCAGRVGITADIDCRSMA